MTLFRKALRDLALHKGAFTACMFMLTIGITVFAALNQVVVALPRAQQAFYKDMRFADAFASVSSMPAGALDALERIDGVAEAQGRLSFMARVLTDDERPVSLRVYAFNPGDEDAINGVLAVSGALPKAGERAMLLTEGYAGANGLSVGDTQTIVVGGRRVDITVAGLAQAPDQIYAIPSAADLIPNDKGYGVAYMPTGVVEQMFGAQGRVNDISIMLDEGQSFALLRSEMEAVLKPYGLLALYGRADQASHFMLETEIESMAAMVGFVPALFLIIGFFMTVIIIKRIVEQQRMQIGLLKSLGYSASAIMAHYGVIGAFIGVGACVCGVALGALLADAMMDLYAVYFHLPGIYGALTVDDVATPAVMTMCVAVAAGIYGARGALGLRAAEAMRPPAPQVGRAVWLERMEVLWRALSTTFKLCLRNMLRKPVRTLATTAGVTIAYALVAALCSMAPLFDEMIGLQFNEVQGYDVEVALTAPAGAGGALRAVGALPGVISAEGVLKLPAVLRSGARHKDVTLTGLETPSALYHVFDERKRVIEPGGGVVINTRAARILGVAVGDDITLELPSLGIDARVQVSGIALEYMGMNAFMERGTLRRITGADAVTGVYLTVSGSGSERAVTDALLEARNVSDAVSVAQSRASIAESFDSQMGVMYYMAGIAMACAFAILYNQGVISLSERTRELASMRIMGFSIMGAAGVLISEQVILAVIGCAVGVPCAYGLLYALMESMSGDAYTIPVVLPPVSYAQGAACVFASVALNALLLYIKVKRLNMVEALKDRE